MAIAGQLSPVRISSGQSCGWGARLLGWLTLKAFLETSSSASPSNLMRAVTADTVEEILHEHKAGLNDWVARNAPFTTAFDRAKLLTRDDRSTGR
jgi:hypothetical protein